MPSKIKEILTSKKKELLVNIWLFNLKETTRFYFKIFKLPWIEKWKRKGVFLYQIEKKFR